MRKRILEEAEERDVRVIVVARAGLDDAAPLELLLDIQNYRSREDGFLSRFALILGCTSRADGSSPKLIRDLRKMDEIKEWLELSGGSWWVLRELASHIDDELGSMQGKARRLITHEVLERAYQRFQDER